MQPIAAAQVAQTLVIDEPALRHGFTVVPNYLFSLKGLSHGARLAYILLLKYAWQQDSCFPGMDRLALQLQVERKSVIRYIKELVSCRLITVERRGQGKTNVYHLSRWPEAPAVKREPTAEGTDEIRGRSPIHGTSRSPIDGTSRSPTGRTQIIYSRQTPKETRPSVNAFGGNGRKDPAHLEWLVEEIVKVCADLQSAGFYRRVAAFFPDEVIFRLLAEIKDDGTIRNRGAVFTTKLQSYAQNHGWTNFTSRQTATPVADLDFNS